MGCTFVHAADLHLDAPFRGITRQFALDSESGKRLQTLLDDATFIVFERLVEVCIAARADFLVLAGDIYNATESSLRAYFSLHSGFSKLANHGIHVFLAHGNHDPLPPENILRPWPNNVTVFGGEVSSYPVTRDGVLIARIYGISHTSEQEPRNLATFFHGRKQKEQTNVVEVGALHCSLQGETGLHARYAPCTGSDLLEAGFDYFALGHVHSCQIFHKQEGGSAYTSFSCSQEKGEEKSNDVCTYYPLYAYSGSAQGLHVNESGPHGCLIVTVNDEKKQTVQFAPLAAVEWETVSISLEPYENEEEPLTLVELGEVVTDQLLALSLTGESELFLQSQHVKETGHEENEPSLRTRLGWNPSARVIRIELTGRTSLHHILMRPENREDLEAYVVKALVGTDVWVREIALSTRPLSLYAKGALARQDFIGELARYSEDLRQRPEELEEVGNEAFSSLYKSIRMRKKVAKPDQEQMKSLLEEARAVCFDLLEPEE